MTPFRDLLDGSQLCAQPTVDPELWWPAPSAEAVAARAVAICRACPFEDACLDFALSATDGHGRPIGGVWGGTTERGRDRLRRKRRAAA